MVCDVCGGEKKRPGPCYFCMKSLNLEFHSKDLEGIKVETIAKAESDYIFLRVTDTRTGFRDREIIIKNFPFIEHRMRRAKQALITRALVTRALNGKGNCYEYEQSADD